ncbi:lipase family protein [Leekyejoonella antrihumi]|uniref:Triacylglycerol lipase n=1 Tax=Leekyejoonella antrihumi TaxID=1660198 RepID=A0A563E2E4_9MICO|nr:lipase family protein [Leekyejoonella antrihumi]TWP36565.1 triacylglycerol lipase [Leekyejoonella antrihumi]
MHRRLSRIALCSLALSTAAAGMVVAPGAHAASSDSFYTYSGSKPLSSIDPGTVLATRTMPYHVVGIPLPIQAVQLLYRSTDAQGRPAANVTTILRTLSSSPSKAVSYQSFYDSMDPADSPSRAIAGDVTLGGVVPNAEAIFLAPLLAGGYSVIVPDTEGQSADFAAGPEYGMNTLDSIRAATHSPATGLNTGTNVGMLGYSGGAIATNWAAQLAPSYAPQVNKHLVGAADGGLLVDPAHNLKYVDGSLAWAGIAPMAIAGVARAYGIDFTPYLSSYGQQIMAKMQNASIVNVYGQYPGLTWKQLAKPKYANPSSIPALVTAINKLNMGSAATPTIPMFIGQGAAGWEEGTSGAQRGIGAGDGVMIAGDVRSLARQFCATGNRAVKYTQYNLTSHVPTAAIWAPMALGWLGDRFAGKAAPSSCGHIPAGNPLAPMVPNS